MNAAAEQAKTLLAGLEKSQWLPRKRLAQGQDKHLARLLPHAHATTGFYAGHWGKAYSPKAPLAALPVLRRADLQDHYEEIKSRALPREHGAAVEARTSGSSGMPVRILKTGMVDLLWRVITLRDHLWHARDFSGKLATIRRRAGGQRFDGWGRATLGVFATGPAVGCESSTGIEAQLDWLEREAPTYLLTYPSLVAELSRGAQERGLRLPSLKGVRTVGELLPQETRELCREAFGVGIVDMYTCEELGYLALQCPKHEHYHVQSENVVLEVVRDDGKPCAPGEVGRVLATSLWNYATPLVRYEVGDFAEVGEPCDCGRGLPVLRRIVGRSRTMFVTAAGERFWPSFGSRSLAKIAPVVQHQFVQKALDLVEARLVVRQPLGAAQEEELRRLILGRMPQGIRLEFSYPERIERGAGGKYEDFRSELAR